MPADLEVNARNGRQATFASALIRVTGALILAALLIAVGRSNPAEAAIPIVDISPSSSSLDPSDPDGASGGRVNGLANVSGDDRVFYAASEWGGLFKSVDAGLNWFRLNNHLPGAVWDVEVDPGNNGTVYATSFFDGRVNNPLSGISVSSDGGATWTRPASATPPGAYNCSAVRIDEPSALGIGIRPDAPANVFVGTNCGVARSTDSGATWTFVDPTPLTTATNVWDVVVQGGGPNNLGIVDVCGDDGVLRSVDGGNTWTGGQGALTDGQDNDGDTNVDEADEILPSGRCSIAASPDENYVLVVVFGTRIFESDNGGTAWSREFVNPSPQGRVPFVATNQRANGGGGANLFDLWFGDVRLHRGGCTTPNPPAQGGAPRCPLSGTWAGPFTRTVGAHDDAGDIVFDSDTAVDACPRIFSSDGGVYYNTDLGADCHNPNWEQPAVTPHALMLWSMDGAHEANDADEDLYFGTQDNGSFGTTNAGAGTPTWTNSDCCDVFDFQGDGDRAIYSFCCGSPRATTLVIRQPDLTGGGGIANNSYPPDGLLTGFNFQDGLDQWGDRRYVMLTLDCTNPSTDGVDNDGDTNIDEADEASNGCPKPSSDGGVFITQDITANPIVWAELGNATEPNSTALCGIQASTPASTPNTPTFYLQVGACTNAAGDQVWKYTGTATNGTWTRIDDNDGLAGGFTFFAVDPNDPNRLYAANPIPSDYQMMFSNDGGVTWDNDAELDNLMDANGFFKAVTVRGPGPIHRSYDFGGYPQPSFVAYDQENGQVLVAGGHDSGVFLSTNGGQNWGLVTDPFNSGASGIPHLPRPFYAYFDHEPAGKVNIYIGTGGRGVWRLSPPTADVSITKTDSPDPVNAGEQLYYTITVTNNGPDLAENVVVQDQLPSQVTYVTDDMGVCTEGPTDFLTCPLGDIPNGESITLVIKVNVDQGSVVTAGGPFGMTNTATVSTSGSIDPDPSDNQASASTIVEDLADLRLTKDCKPDQPLLAGETATCSIVVDNLGPSDARTVVVTDTHISDGTFTITSATFDPPPNSPCTIAGGVVTCNIGTLPAGARVTITVRVTADRSADINDRACVTSETPDPDTSNNCAEDSVVVQEEADLRLVKDCKPDQPLLAGDTATCTIIVDNLGPSDARNVVVTDTHVSNGTFTIVSATFDPPPNSPCTIAGGVVTCNLGTVPAGGRVTITVLITTNEGGDINDFACVTSDSPDPDPSNNCDEDHVTVTAVADVSITKTDSEDPLVSGTTLTYTLTVTNSGPSTAINVVVEDLLPAGVAIQSVGATGGGSCVFGVPGDNDRPTTCNFDSIAPSGSEVMTITVTVLPGAHQVLHDDARVSSDTLDMDNSDNIDSEDTQVHVADIEMSKTSPADTGQPSQNVSYTLRVTNHGPGDAHNVVVTDNLPLRASDRVAIFPGSGGNVCTKPKGSTLVTCNMGTITAGTSKFVVIVVIYKGSRGIVANTADATTTTFDFDLANNTSTKLVLVGQPPKP